MNRALDERRGESLPRYVLLAMLALLLASLWMPRAPWSLGARDQGAPWRMTPERAPVTLWSAGTETLTTR